MFFRTFANDANRIEFGKIENYLVQNVHTDKEKNTLHILVGKRERTIGDSNYKFKENNHHAISTHWYKVIHVTFYTLVHIFEDILGGNSKIGNDNY